MAYLKTCSLAVLVLATAACSSSNSPSTSSGGSSGASGSTAAGGSGGSGGGVGAAAGASDIGGGGIGGGGIGGGGTNGGAAGSGASAGSGGAGGSGGSPTSGPLPHGNGRTFYIATSGSDSNSGTSKSSPWLHIPGESGCTANCAATTPGPGDNFIFRGGDHWHEDSGAGPGIGFTQWQWSGSGTSCDVYNGKTGSCIYIGVDTSWYTGSSWTRPIIDYDNPPSTSAVSSCKYANNNSLIIFNMNTASYVTFDDFEIVGNCQADADDGQPSIWNLYNSLYVTVADMYWHGWTHVSSCGNGVCADQSLVYGNSSYTSYTGPDHSYILDNTLNGSDSPPGQGSLCKYPCQYVVGNTVRYAMQGIVGDDTAVFADNWIDHLSNPWDGPADHGNVDEMNQIKSGTIYVYDNLLSNSQLEVGYWIGADGGSTLYFYNNVVYGISGQGGNCLMLGGNGGAATYNFYNNSMDSSCGVNFTSNSTSSCAQGASHWTNNIYVSSSSYPQTYTNGCSSSDMSVTHTNDYLMPASESSSYGFASANQFKPSSSDPNTTHKGTNFTSSCSGDLSALCNDAQGTVWYGGSYSTRPTSGAWNLGAFN
jgi:hypothetical protein